MHPRLQVPRPAGTADRLRHVRLFQEPVWRRIHAGIPEGKRRASRPGACKQLLVVHASHARVFNRANFICFFLISRHATTSSAAWQLTAWCSSCCRLKTGTMETSCWTARATSSTLVRRGHPQKYLIIFCHLDTFRHCLIRM